MVTEVHYGNEKLVIPVGVPYSIDCTGDHCELRVQFSSAEETVFYNYVGTHFVEGTKVLYCEPSKVFSENGKPLVYKVQSLLAM